MSLRVFVSTEDSADRRASLFVGQLRGAGITVICSPLNPALGDDPRWRDWYKTGCKATIEATDVFVAVVTAGYDGSTWMAIEADTALALKRKLGKPRLSLLKLKEGPLPAGFRAFEGVASVLPLDPTEAAAVLLEGRER